MLSIKGREPFIRMQLWLNDSHNIEKLQTLKNERREANKRRRTALDEPVSHPNTVKPLGDNIYFSGDFNTSPNSVSHSSSKGILGGGRPSYGSPAVKKARILFSEEQKEALRVAFSMDPYPSTTTIEFLATELNLSLRTITNWFHNHRMRLKQVTSTTDDNSSNQSQLPYNIGRDSVNFDPIQFRLLLTQRLASIRLQNATNPPSPSHRSKYSSLYQTSPVGSQLYANTSTCSSPGSSLQEDDMGTLDLSMTASQQNKDLNRHSLSINDDSDASGSDNESVELDLSKTAPRIGSSRRKPQMVTSSSSRRKPAQPQWVDPGLEFSGDEDDDYADDGLSDDMIDDDDAYDLAQPRNEIINGVCVRQTLDDMIRNRRRDALDFENDNSVRMEPTAAFASFRTKIDAKNNGNERQNNIKRLEKCLEEDEEGWDDDEGDDEVRPGGKGGINDDNVLEECVQ